MCIVFLCLTCVWNARQTQVSKLLLTLRAHLHLWVVGNKNRCLRHIPLLLLYWKDSKMGMYTHPWLKLYFTSYFQWYTFCKGFVLKKTGCVTHLYQKHVSPVFFTKSTLHFSARHHRGCNTHIFTSSVQQQDACHMVLFGLSQVLVTLYHPIKYIVIF